MPSRNAKIRDQLVCDNEKTEHRVLDGERIRKERIANRRGERIETFGRGQIRESEERPSIHEYKVIRKTASSSNDGPVLMININEYLPEAGYPDGKLYQDYMKAMHVLVDQIGAKILWRIPVLGQPVGSQSADEIIAAW